MHHASILVHAHPFSPLISSGRGLNPPWRHFIPKLLKIGPRTIEYATIKAVTAGHNINSTMYYELFYDNYTGDASVVQSHGANPLDYVWEYVVECTDGTQPCEMNQVNAFNLRNCPRGYELSIEVVSYSSSSS